MSSGESFLLALAPLLLAVPEGQRTPEEQVIVLVWELEAEVNNGGFHQFYFNTAGDHAAKTPAALAAIGASRTAELVEAANRVLPGGPHPDRKRRQAQLEALTDPEVVFEALDARFYAYEEDLSSLLHTYVEKHRAQIRSPQ